MEFVVDTMDFLETVADSVAAPSYRSVVADTYRWYWTAVQLGVA